MFHCVCERENTPSLFLTLEGGSSRWKKTKRLLNLLVLTRPTSDSPLKSVTNLVHVAGVRPNLLKYPYCPNSKTTLGFGEIAKGSGGFSCCAREGREKKNVLQPIGPLHFRFNYNSSSLCVYEFVSSCSMQWDGMLHVYRFMINFNFFSLIYCSSCSIYLWD